MVAGARDSATAPLLLNRAHSERVLDQHGLDGLLAAQPVNVCYLSNYWGAGSGLGRDPLTFAALPRRPDAAAALVLGSGELRRLSSSGGTWMPNVVAYRSSLDGRAPPGGWPARAGADLAPNELEWLALEDRLRGTESASAILGLARAVREAGLERAVVGIDDWRLEKWLRAAGLLETRFVYAEHLFAAIRRVKSPAEIALLRTAAALNETACLEAAQHVEEGSDWQVIENVYVAEFAQRGGRGCRLATGPGGLPGLAVRRGEPTAIASLGHYRQYHGSVGRTLCVGEPDRELLERHAALQRGWREAAATLRPGLGYREVAARCVAAVRAQGFADFMLAVPRSIGLASCDDPMPSTVRGTEHGDPLLEPGVVFEVELPYSEIGWGSMQLADTLLVTADGCEPLTSMQTDLLILP
jgi:Xaa-Pro dipeptidase